MSTFERIRAGVLLLGLMAGLPVGAQSTVGRTIGEAGISSTGAARYTVPIDLPPGTNGLAPKLAVVYDSRGGNGLLGAGFRLEGFSIVHRCHRTLAQDGTLGSVTLDRSDRYCLDGKRLRLTAGTHGYGGAQYQLEVEEFARVTSYGTAGNGPAYFQVEARDGRVYEYGATADSRIESSGSATPRAWALNRIRDRDGNYIDFVYAEDAVNGGHRPVRIDYTGNSSYGNAPYYAVRFVYEQRPATDLRSGYFAGGRVSEMQRLARIEVQHYGSNVVLRRYEFSYAAEGPSGRSRLGSLQACAGTGECLPGTTFEWDTYQPGWGGELATGAAGPMSVAVQTGDADGDGFEDLVYFDTSTLRWSVLRGQSSGFASALTNTGYGATSTKYEAISIDLDGNGKRDVLVPDSGGTWYWLRHLTGTTYAYGATGAAYVSASGSTLALDVDGDGREDLVYARPNGNAILWRRNLTSGGTPSFAAEAALWTAPGGALIPSSPFGSTEERLRSMLRQGDFNGDGRDDVLLRQPGTCSDSAGCASSRWLALVSLGASFETAATFDTAVAPSLGDFNGDGLTDVAYPVTGADGTETWNVAFATGSRGAVKAGFTSPVVTAATTPVAPVMIIDWDADGRSDLLYPVGSSDWQYCRSGGTTIEACRPAGFSGLPSGAYPLVMDINGDGLGDVAYASMDWRYRLHRPGYPDVLASATDGYGNFARYQYASLSDASVHSRSTTSAYPVRDYSGALRVVSRLTRSDGNGGSYVVSATYAGAKIDTQGRGFLGFARRTLTDGRTGAARVDTFYQDPNSFELIGRPYTVTQQQVYGSPIRRETYTWWRFVINAGPEARRFPYPSSILTELYELDGARVATVTTRNTYDAYGTLTDRSTTTTEVSKGLNAGAQHFESVSLLNVVNDTANWCLGRPSSVLTRRSHTLAGGGQVVRTSDHTWDYQRCRETQRVEEPASATLRVAIDLAYDVYGNLYSETVTPVGQASRRTSYTWSDGGRFPGTVSNAEGHATSTGWDPVRGRPNWSRDPNGLTTQWQYDAFDRVARQVNPDGTSVVTTRALCSGTACASPGARYRIARTLVGVGDVRIAGGEQGFDAFDREVYTKNEMPGGSDAYRVLRYDNRGLLAQESVPGLCCSVPSRWITHGYDVIGRRVSTQRPTSEAVATPVTRRWRYDGLAVTETDVLGRETMRYRDAIGNVIRVIDATRADTDYEYDAFDDLVRVRDVAGNETVIGYDIRGRRTSVVDVDAGRWTFEYTPVGELSVQTNARGQVTRYAYDRLGRVTARTEPEGTTTWTWGASTSAANVGALASVASPGFKESYVYDGLGRMRTVTRVVAGTTLTTGYSYDPSTGLLDTLTYPAISGTSALRVKHGYDRAHLVRLSDADQASTEFWRLDSADPRQNPTSVTLGNGIRMVSTFDAVTGLPLGRTSGPGGGATTQNLRYTWDAAGNLRDRTDANSGLSEQFNYDALDRLDFVQRWGTTTLDLSYDALGNLTFKSDIGSYRYDAVRKHAVVSAGSNTYSYDANGAVTQASGSTIAWYSYDLPSQLTHPNGNYSAFYYDADRARYRQVARAGASLTDTLYAANGLYERFTRDGVTGERQYIVADGEPVAVRTRLGTAAPTIAYTLPDHLGGIDAFTSSTGALLARTSYHPFGARRAGDGIGTAPTSAEWKQIQAASPRGYTGHEHIDNLGVIHMNGRVFDPVLGRFLSPDPYVQSPYDAQSLNRYSYVLNNPLRYTDPSGFSCFNGHPADDLGAQSCMEEILVRGWRQLGQYGQEILDGLGRAVDLQADMSEAGSIQPVRQDSAFEEIVVRGWSEEKYPSVATDPTLYAPLPSWFENALRSASGDLLITVMLGVAAGVEPTPVGEAAFAARALSHSRALSTIRYTRPGETFVRYESSNVAFSRVTATGGLRPGSYAAPLSDGLIPLSRRASVYNLPDPQILRTESYILRPPANTIIIGPRPVVGGTGNEVLFPYGF